MQGTRVLNPHCQQKTILMCQRDRPGGKENFCFTIFTQAVDQAEDDLPLPPIQPSLIFFFQQRGPRLGVCLARVDGCC